MTDLMTAYLLVLAGLLLLLLSWFVWRLLNRRLLHLASKIPGPPGLPFLGHTLMFLGSPHDTFTNVMSYSEDYQDVVKMWIGPRFFVFLTNPLDIEVLLTSKNIDKAEEYGFMKPWMGDGLLLSTDENVKAELVYPEIRFCLQYMEDILQKGTNQLQLKEI